MRYKLIHFYLPLHQKSILSRVRGFDFGVPSGGYDVTTERPGSTITEDNRDYNNIPGTDTYTSYILSNRFMDKKHSNWFVKVIAESDPLFNLDIMGTQLYSFVLGDALMLKGDSIVRIMLPQYLGDEVLSIEV